MQIFDIIALPLSIALEAIYNIVKNYGLAIIIFTIIIRLILLPLSVKQMRSQQEMQRLQPRIKEIEKRFKGDKQKISEETMKLYKQENVSMTGGCLPLVIQLPIIIGLYQVIYRPLFFMYHFVSAQITSLREVYGIAENVNESAIARAMAQNPSKMSGIVENWQNFDFINFNFLGIDLSGQPSIDFSSFSAIIGSADMLWLIPLFAFLTAVFSAIMTKKYMPAPAAGDNPMASQTAKMSKFMVWMMPVMSLYFSFILPAGVGLYWGVANLIAGVQQFMIFKTLKPLPPLELDGEIEKRERKEAMAQKRLERQEQLEREARMAEKRRSPGQSSKASQGKKKSLAQGGQSGNNPGQRRPSGQKPPGKRPPGRRPKNWNIDDLFPVQAQDNEDISVNTGSAITGNTAEN